MILNIFIIGFCVGLIIVIAVDYIERKLACRKSKMEGDRLIEKAQEASDILSEQALYKVQKENNKLLSVFEKKEEEYKNRIRKIQSKVDNKIHKIKMISNKHERQSDTFNKELSGIQKKLQSATDQIQSIMSSIKEGKKKVNDQIQNKFSFNSDDIKQELKTKIKEEWLKEITEDIKKQETDEIQDMDKTAIRKINLVLNRFERAYCPRRTIEPVELKNAMLFDKIVGKDQAHIKEIENECGVDIVANKEDLIIKILGIDPVRRELGRLSIRALLKKKTINSDIIKSVVKTCKKDLFETIRKDGKNLAKNLKLKDVSLEVLDVMGSLKYRYSFAQNQYYHCEEVGWLCGLMSSEFDLPLLKGRRAGGFHDIGKAMDHSMEGSHAVIGADLLEKNQEEQDVVHAVRAHHHDETPSTPLAYLVIAADAISGSRPGARHFTEDSYHKKMTTLNSIIESFDNIEDGYIMSAGREMRIIVDSKKVSDQDTLELSKQIARKIEKECSYPGLIKVTVVRHSEVVSIAN